MSTPKLATAIARAAALAMLIVAPNSFVWAGVAPAGLASQQPRDPRSDVPRPETARELELKTATAGEPTRVAAWLELAKLQEARGAVDEAERTLTMAADAVGSNPGLLNATASFFNRAGRFDRAIAALEAAAELDNADPRGHQLVATYYFEKVSKDHAITAADKVKYIDGGLAATNRALAQKADYVDALVYKNMLLRVKANLEPDLVLRAALVNEADLLREQAAELHKSQAPAVAQPGVPGAPPPPPAPGAPVRVGGNIKTPAKTVHVSPVYPPEAQDARVAGLVIIEATIGVDGSVESAKVLRSVPMLDQAAVDAVKQWRFTPTILNGVPVQVVMTVTVNFTLQ